ncbi:MAG TPA: flagellar export protein FliJ [Oscillatoriaceae cyanobacterium]
MPKRFRFRYQTVLEVRERRQKQEEEALTRLLGEQSRAERVLAKLKEEEATRKGEFVALQGMVDLDTLVLYQNYFGEIERRVRVQQDEVDTAIARVNNQRDLLAEAMREAEVMKKLKERDEKAWRDEIEQAEAALIDELAMGRHVRKSDGSP